MLIASRLVIDKMVASTSTSTGGPKTNDKMIKGKTLSRAYDLMICTFFLYKQHFYKQRQAEIGKKSSKC